MFPLYYFFVVAGEKDFAGVARTMLLLRGFQLQSDGFGFNRLDGDVVRLVAVVGGVEGQGAGGGFQCGDFAVA